MNFGILPKQDERRKELEAIGEKELYRDWLKLLSNKNVKISYVG